MSNDIKISIVSPVYGAEHIVHELVSRIEGAIKPMFGDSYEIVLVEDRSPDGSWAKIEEIAQLNSKVKAIRLSRNYGQHFAITAGLDYCVGQHVVVMDCDLQDQPEEIPKMYAKLQEGYDYVVASRSKRQDTFFKRFFSKLFHNVLTYLSGTDHDASVANFGIYNRNVIDAIGRMRESIRYFPTMRKWVGFSSSIVEVEHSARFEGETTYNFGKLINLALDIMLAYSDKPIRIFVKSGLILSSASIILALAYIVATFVLQAPFNVGTVILIVMLFFFGLIISILGIIGLYIGKIFENVKQRPIYLVDKSINLNK